MPRASAFTTVRPRKSGSLKRRWHSLGHILTRKSRTGLPSRRGAACTDLKTALTRERLQWAHQPLFRPSK
jgi:hypothetical protein